MYNPGIYSKEILYTMNNSIDLTGKRIFLVEDDILNLAVVTRVLANSQALVMQNYNSIGVVTHIIQNLPIDLILMDVMLRRGINGFEVTRELKLNPQTTRIPIVAVSSLDPEIAIPQAKDAGCSGFISKPINSQTFAAELAAILRGEERWVTSR